MIFVIIIAHAAQKSQHNFRFFRPAAAEKAPSDEGGFGSAHPQGFPYEGKLAAERSGAD